MSTSRRGRSLSRRFGWRASRRWRRRWLASGTGSGPSVRAAGCVGRGWRDAAWAARPTKEALDEVTGEVPVALLAHDSHSLWINSAALSRADGDLDVDGGVVERDARGEATGVLREEACWRFRDRHIHIADEEYLQAMREGLRVAAAQRRHGGPRQGRLDRRAEVLAVDRGCRRAHAPGLAVAARRLRRRVGRPRDARRPRRRDAPDRLPEGVHGRDARLADRADARRHRRRDHEPRGAGGASFAVPPLRAGRSRSMRSATSRTAKRSMPSRRPSRSGAGWI